MLSDTKRVWGKGGRNRKNGASLPRMLFNLEEDIVTRSLVRALSDCFTDYDIEFVTAFNGDAGSVSLFAFCPDRTDDTATMVAQMRQHFPGAVIVLLVPSMFDIPQIAEELVRSGQLQGVLPLTLPLPVWLAVFGLLLNGGVYFPPDIPSRRHAPTSSPNGAQRAAEPSLSSESGLTHREEEVLNLLALGFQNKIIASRLALSEHTVKIHVHNIIHKLGVHNRTEAAAHRLNAVAVRGPAASGGDP